MATTKPRTIHKHFRLDPAQLKRAQKALAARTETETIQRALEMAVTEHARSRLAVESNQRFLRGKIAVRDVFASLEG